MKDTINKISITYLVIGLIIGLILGFIIFNNKESISQSNVVENITNEDDVLNTNNNTEEVEEINYNVSAQNQSAGDIVLVSSISLEKTAWVAVREDKDGELWNILGARKLPKGEYKNVLVDLLRNTESNQNYHVVIYEEDGDGIFDQRSDTLVSSNGVFIDSVFVAR